MVSDILHVESFIKSYFQSYLQMFGFSLKTKMQMTS